VQDRFVSFGDFMAAAKVTAKHMQNKIKPDAVIQ